jgi:hypothetical protein
MAASAIPFMIGRAAQPNSSEFASGEGPVFASSISCWRDSAEYPGSASGVRDAFFHQLEVPTKNWGDIDYAG